MSNMDVWRGLRWVLASTMRLWRHFHSSSDPVVANLWATWPMQQYKGADSHLKLLPLSILDMYKVVGHIDMLFIGTKYQPYAVIPTLTWLRFWGSGSHVESKQCDYVMVEADNHLKLLSASILDMYKVFEHIVLLCWSLAYGSSLTQIYPPLLGSDFGALGHLWSQFYVIMSCLRLTATSNCFPHPSNTFTNSVSTLICCP
jgi:hypothetical protein